MNTNRIYWGSGVLVAFAGVAMVRLLPEVLMVLRTGGFVLAGVGLLIIALGVRHRIEGDE